jgi:hypothetical protein
LPLESEDDLRRKGNRGGAVIEFALVAPLLVSLIVGTMMYGIEFVNELQLQQVARDTASMTARGTNFNLAPNQVFVAKIGEDLKWPVTGLTSTSPGVVYVSTIEYLDSTCLGSSPVCSNHDKWVFVRSTAFGNTSMRRSNFGAPAACLPSCLDTKQTDGSLNYTDVLNNPGAVVSNFTYLGTPSSSVPGFQPGQPAFLIETAAPIGPWNGGTIGYAFSIF